SPFRVSSSTILALILSAAPPLRIRSSSVSSSRSIKLGSLDGGSTAAAALVARCRAPEVGRRDHRKAAATQAAARESGQRTARPAALPDAILATGLRAMFHHP